MQNLSVMFSTGNNNMSTPKSFFDKLNEVFHFTLDPCADDTNHKCDQYYTEEENGLTKTWGGKLFSVICLIREERKPNVGRKILYRNVCRNGKKTMLHRLC